jgi:hypothetical protein
MKTFKKISVGWILGCKRDLYLELEVNMMQYSFYDTFD